MRKKKMITTNYWRCDLCKELIGEEQKEFYLDDLRVCQSCYESETENCEITIQEIERAREEMLDNEMEETHLRKLGIEI